MGAEFQAMEVDGMATKQEVVAQFDSRCDQDGYEYGYSYSGSFSQFKGLRFVDKVFTSETEACDYIQEHGEKWGPAVAVKYTMSEPSKRMEAHQKAVEILNRKVWRAESRLRNATLKMRINNRSEKPSYVTKAEANVKQMKDSVIPKITKREKSILEIVEKLAAKSKKTKWILGGWCSS